MILLRSIRRRLVTGFTIALAFLLTMAAAAIWGLIRHQEAIAELDLLVNRPDEAGLLKAVMQIRKPLNTRVNLSQEAAVVHVQTEFVERIRTAQREAEEFFRRCEEVDHQTQELTGGRHPVLQGTQHAVYDSLKTLLQEISPRIAFSTDTNMYIRAHMLRDISMLADIQVDRIVTNLSRLPSYDGFQRARASLEMERQRSRWLLHRVLVVIAIAVVSYMITVICGFQWISNPLRAIARGASRIANGDTRYRLTCTSPWDDEFANLTQNFNRMADRFQESEDQLNAKVQERSRQLVRSERLAGVGFLAAGVAHEINNPLQAMSMAAESVQFRLHDHLDPEHPDSTDIMERLTMIQTESKRCGQITRRLLDFSRNERQEKQQTDLTTIIREVLAMVRPMGQFRDRHLTFERTQPVLAEVNASQMKQVILNLVANGLQATDTDGTVEVVLCEQTDWVVVEIRDNGMGMKPEDMEQLFEPFFSTKETGEGTGLGLSITHRIVQDHHGTIEPSSAGPGQGSTFIIRLPRRQPQQAAA